MFPNWVASLDQYFAYLLHRKCYYIPLLSVNSLLCVWIVVHFFKIIFLLKNIFERYLPLAFPPFISVAVAITGFCFTQRLRLPLILLYWNAGDTEKGLFWEERELAAVEAAAGGISRNALEAGFLQYWNLKTELLLTKDCPWVANQALLIFSNEYGVTAGLQSGSGASGPGAVAPNWASAPALGCPGVWKWGNVAACAGTSRWRLLCV